MHDDDFDVPIPEFDDLLEEFNQLVLGIAAWADATRETLQGMVAFLSDEDDPDDDGFGDVKVTLPAPGPRDHDGLGLSVARHLPKRHIGPTVVPMTTVPFETDAARTRAANAGWDS